MQIAYVVGQIIDNGEAIVNRAGRIHPDFEAKGLSKRLNQYVYDWGLSRGVKKIVFTVSDGYPYLSKESFRRVTKHISTKVSKHHMATATSVRPVTVQNNLYCACFWDLVGSDVV